MQRKHGLRIDAIRLMLMQKGMGLSALAERLGVSEVMLRNCFISGRMRLDWFLKMGHCLEMRWHHLVPNASESSVALSEEQEDFFLKRLEVLQLFDLILHMGQLKHVRKQQSVDESQLIDLQDMQLIEVSGESLRFPQGRSFSLNPQGKLFELVAEKLEDEVLEDQYESSINDRKMALPECDPKQLEEVNQKLKDEVSLSLSTLELEEVREHCFQAVGLLNCLEFFSSTKLFRPRKMNIEALPVDGPQLIV